MRFYLKTLRANLFFYQSLLIVLILIIAGIFSYIYISRNFIRTILMEQNSLGTSLAGSLESELEKMNIVSMNISYSNLLKGMFREYQEYNDPLEYSYGNKEKYTDQNMLLDSILAVMGHFHTVSQVNLYTFDGFMVGSGLFNEETQVSFSERRDIQKAIKLDGYKYLTTPLKNEYLVNRNLHLKDHYFISLMRVFKNQHYQNEGIVEVLQDCERLFTYLEIQKKRKSSLRVFIFNDLGETIYPYDRYIMISPEDLLSLTRHRENENSIHTIELPGGPKSEIFSSFKIEKYGLHLLILESGSIIMSPLRKFQIVFFIFLFFITVYTIFVSYSVSSRVTRPLDKLVKYLSTMQLNSFSLEKYEKSRSPDRTFEEIDSLYSAFNLMSGKLKTSLNELIELKDQESLTRLLALQSQMNPHFLYNNLANISILAEEGKNSQVISMCRDISYMLRYSAVNEPRGASIKEEMEYVRKYLTCMKLRYEHDLSFTISVPDSMNTIRIPRILVQPLVENSINHGFTIEPPWSIEIIGEIKDQLWTITVKDNGAGYTDEILQKISADKKGKNQADHIGLENTRQRLDLIYGERAIFSLSNLPHRGACTIIGGDIHYREDEYERKI